LINLIQGDCAEKLKELADNSVDAVVTDPPAGISFMGKEWDNHKGGRDKWIGWMCGIATECLRVLKPGGHALVWAIPRTSHWTATAWEDAGFEVRDRLVACFGSGFPKSQDVSKMIDKRAGAEREVLGMRTNGNKGGGVNTFDDDSYIWDKPFSITVPATDEAKRHAGFGTALKPAVEDWWLLRKPLDEKTIAENVLEWGTGAINIDGCRVEIDFKNEKPADGHTWNSALNNKKTRKLTRGKTFGDGSFIDGKAYYNAQGRWPANIVIEDCGEVRGMFPITGGGGASTMPNDVKPGFLHGLKGHNKKGRVTEPGSASRFFFNFKFDEDDRRFIYCPKASKKDRDEGLEGFETKSVARMGHGNNEPDGKTQDFISMAKNSHPTVKATELMRWLCRLITPPGGIVLDPFMGSGSTGKACALEGFSFIGIELDKEYLEIARARIEFALNKKKELDKQLDFLQETV